LRIFEKEKTSRPNRKGVIKEIKSISANSNALFDMGGLDSKAARFRSP